MNLDALDRWITSGRYEKELLRVTCPECREASAVTAETEYGATTWIPEECPSCGAEWGDDPAYEPDEPPEPDPYEERMR